MLKVIKISAIWCNGCLVMNKIWNDILKNNSVLTISLDYDIDYLEVEKYNVGKILPVFIFYKDNIEVERVVGERSFKEMKELTEQLLNE